MRFLYSHRTRSADGQYVHIRELTDALKAQGHDILISGPGGAAEKNVKNLDAGGGRSLRGLGALYEAAELGYSLPAYWGLHGQYRAFAPDILYQRYNLFYYPGAWLKKRTGVPLMLEVNAPLAEERARHGGLALTSLARKTEADIWRAADMVLPVTNVMADYVRAAGVSDDKITVIQNGVNDAFLAEQDGGEVKERYNLAGKLVLGFTGFARSWHQLERAVKFIAAAGRPELHLLIVGDGPACADLKALAAACGVGEQLTITGVVQREEMPAHVAAFDIALQPAVTAYASPLKIFEYMALAKPILAPATKNIREILQHGENALLFDDEAGAPFDKCLMRLVEDAPLRAKLGAEARASLLRQDLTWTGNARRVAALAEKLLEAGQ